MADGTSFQIDLAVKAEGVSSAADLLDRYAAKLDTASKASESASAAVKAGETAYKQAESSYDRASKALERINVAMQTASGKTLENLVTRQAEAARAAQSARVALDGEALTLDRLRSSAAAADTQVDALTQAQTAAKKAIEAGKKAAADSSAANELLAGSLGKIGGPLGVAGQKAFELRGAWDKMGKALGEAGPYVAIGVAFVAIAASIAAVTVAAASGVAQIGAWAVGLADAARTQGLLAAGIAHSVKGGAALDDKVTDLARRLPQTTEEIVSMADQLSKTGLRGKALTDTLEKNAIAAAKLKFGPDWQKQMISLEQSNKRLRANVDGLFSGLKIDALLEGLSSLVGLFDESSSSGAAIKVVFESLFQPLVDGATGMVPVVRHGFLQFEILALKALIAIKPWGSTMMQAAKFVGLVGAVMLGVLAVGIGVVVVLCAALVGAIVGPIALFAALAVGLVYLGGILIDVGSKFVTGLVDGITEAWTSAKAFGSQIIDALSNISLADVGAALIDGLVTGITSGATAVINAVTGVATGAIDAAKKALGIASPSKVFAEIGAFTAEGMEQGIDRNSGSVEAAMTDLATPPDAAQQGGGGGGRESAASAGHTFQITIQAAGGTAEDIAEKVRQVIIDITEGAAIQLGTAVPA